MFDSRAAKYTAIPKPSEWKPDADVAYEHYCRNEKVNGVEVCYTPAVGSVPLTGDESSNFLPMPIEASKHAIIYARIQEKLGPADLCMATGRRGHPTPPFCGSTSRSKKTFPAIM